MFELNSRSTKTESTDLRELLIQYFKYWYLFAIGTLLCVGAAFLYIRYKTVPQYLISSSVLIKDKDAGSSATTAETLGNLGLIKPSGNIDDQIGILGSTSLMKKVLDGLNLNVNYQIKGQVKDVTVYWKNLPFYIATDDTKKPLTIPPFIIQPKDSLSFYYKNSIGEENAQGKTLMYGENIQFGSSQFQVLKNPLYSNISKIHGPVLVNFIDTKNLAEAYCGQLKIETVNTTGSLLKLTMLDAIPQRGEDIILDLLELYAEESVKYQNQLAISTIEIIDQRLKLLTGEITDVEKDIAEYKQDNDLTNISSDAAIYLQSAKESSRRLEEYQTQIDILASIESYMRNGNDNRLVPSSLNIQDPTLSALISQFNANQLERKNLLRSTPEDNPLIVNIDRTLADLRSDLLENLKNIKNSLQIAQNNERQNSYRSQSKIAKVPTAERALLTINRDQGIKQDLYLYLLQKREEEALSLEAPISNTRIVDAPSSTNYPVSPNKTSIYIGALIFGIFLPFTFVFVKNQVNNKITGVSDISKLTNTPYLGEISHNDKNATLIVGENTNTSAAELFRLMRFNIVYQTSGRSNKVILVTSGKQGEGKTFFTINIAASLALAGHKVICLSFDLRAPRLSRNLNLKSKKGITDYILDKNTTIAEITTDNPEIEGFSTIGSGQILPNAGELMTHPRVGVLIEELKRSYDFILIDSAPVGKVADAYGLAPYIDTTVFLIRQDYSSKTEVKILDDIYKNQKLNYPMAVLNDTNAKNKYGYGDLAG